MFKHFFRKKKATYLKEAIKSLGQILIGDPVIRVEEFDGIFAVGVSSDLCSRILIKKRYEPRLVNLCKRYLNKDRDVIDIGANVGFYTVLFAKNISHRSKVLAVEPTKNATQRLRRNIELNGVMNKVEVFKGAVSNKNGTCRIHTVEGKEEYSSLGAMDHPKIKGKKWVTEKVMQITLDKLIEQKSLNPGFLKVDVEGSEHLVFEGAQNVLFKNRPVILSELSDFLLKKNGSSSKEVVALIKSYGYNIFNAADESIFSETKPFGDILCLPQGFKG